MLSKLYCYQDSHKYVGLKSNSNIPLVKINKGHNTYQINIIQCLYCYGNIGNIDGVESGKYSSEVDMQSVKSSFCSYIKSHKYVVDKSTTCIAVVKTDEGHICR